MVTGVPLLPAVVPVKPLAALKVVAMAFALTEVALLAVKVSPATPVMVALVKAVVPL